MSNRYNITNTGGNSSTSGGNMPTDNATNQTVYLSRVTGLVSAPTVTASGHAVEVDGDGGCWDTTSGVAVSRDKTNLDTITL